MFSDTACKCQNCLSILSAHVRIYLRTTLLRKILFKKLTRIL